MIKCGVKGLYLKTGRNLEMPEEWQNKELFEPGFQADIVRSAAWAGDVTIAAFLQVFWREKTLADVFSSVQRREPPV